MARLDFHPCANIFSLLTGEDYSALRASITAGGVREKIVLYEGKILDGRNRYRAALDAGVAEADIPSREFDPEKEGDPALFVWDANVNRRHLNETQRALAAAEMETYRHGGRRETQDQHAGLGSKPLTRQELAERYGISHDSMYKMSVVRDQGLAKLKELARAGEISVRTAKTIADLPAEEQESIMQEIDAVGAADKARALQTAAAKAVQRAKLAEIAKTNRALEPGSYDCLLADPSWQFDAELTGSSRAIENHYPTMSLDAICALPVAKLAAPHAILFLWTTDHHLRDGSAEDVIRAWGFGSSRAAMVWVKDKPGMGRFVRNRHEHLLIATRGEFPAPPTDTIPDSVIEAPRGAHSEKPPLHPVIEAMTPGLDRRIELFARKSVPGWVAWGNQVDNVAP